MQSSWLGFIELFFVLLFGLAWAILEWVGRRLDRQRERERAAKDRPPLS